MGRISKRAHRCCGQRCVCRQALKRGYKDFTLFKVLSFNGYYIPHHKVFGFDLKAGLKKEYYGITGEPAVCYFHPARLEVVGLSHFIDLTVAFTDASSVGALLGQADFFQHFKITFERYKERMEVTPSRS